MVTVATALALSPAAAQTHGPAADLQPVVRFSDYGPLSANAELIARTLTPLEQERARRKLQARDARLPEQSVDLAQESFVVRMPPASPPNGYGLMVFVPPYEEALVPAGWGPVLDRHGVIFVSAARSGNAASVLGRRIPLALLAAHNVMARYRVDPARVWVAGMSGGSRVAMRLALDYPDLFHGALLNAGSDPIDARPTHLPDKALMSRFQAETRLVYLTGAEDAANLAADAASIASMRRNCVFDIDVRITPGVGHRIADARALESALAALQAHASSAYARLFACRAAMEEAVARSLNQAEALISAGRRAEAAKALGRLDATFGGYAGPRVVELARRCDCGLLD